MYLGVDIGGTKTLVAVFDDSGETVESQRFPTPEDYQAFLQALSQAVGNLQHKDFVSAAVAVPGRLDRANGVVLGVGNLPWKHEPIQEDCAKVLGCSTAIENDANLGALGEAVKHPEAETLLYITLSTGIGTGVTRQQRLAPDLLDMEGGHVLVEHDGKPTKWESFASGKAIFKRYGKKVSDIPASDVDTWNHIVDDLVVGLYASIATVQPDLVVIGGGVGTHFDRYGDLLNSRLQQYTSPVVDIPKVIGADDAETAVIHGCYQLAKQAHGDATADK